MLELRKYRFISGRQLLSLKKLPKCQNLSTEVWTTAENFCHFIFISHRWSNKSDPDPDTSQLIALKLLVQEIEFLARIISDERTDSFAIKKRIKQIPSLQRQGTLQAAHLVFRCLCASDSHSAIKEKWNNGQGILDLIGFWYDYVCLPQDPKTREEEEEFIRALLGIDKLLLSPQVSTIVLRKEGDGFLTRGWCFAESMISLSKSHTTMPMVLRIDQLGEPFSVFGKKELASMYHWENLDSQTSSWAILSEVIQLTALHLIIRADPLISEFALAVGNTRIVCTRLLANIHPYLLQISEGSELDLEIPLASLLESQGLVCRDKRDAVLVALLLLKSVTSQSAKNELSIWWQALVRFSKGYSLKLSRQNGRLKWCRAMH